MTRRVCPQTDKNHVGFVPAPNVFAIKKIKCHIRPRNKKSRHNVFTLLLSERFEKNYGTLLLEAQGFMRRGEGALLKY